MPAPSETLLTAADLIRDLAAKAMPGPWSVDELASYFTDGDDAAWIAALSPAVAPLLISWLEAEAACMASVSDVERVMPQILDGINPGAGDEDTTITVTIDTSGPALAFARAILGDTP